MPMQDDNSSEREPLAYRDEQGRAAIRRSGILDGLRPALGHDADGCGESVGDAHGARLPERSRDRLPGQPASWPPSPDDADGWRAYLAAGGPAPTQPAVRRGSARAAVLVDSLRCLGNAVCPPQAEAAFRELARRVVSSKNKDPQCPTP